MLFFLFRNWRQSEAAIANLVQSPCSDCPEFDAHFRLAFRAAKTRNELKKIRAELSDDNLTLFPDLSARLNVLRNLSYVSESDEGTVQLKVAFVLLNFKKRKGCT